MTKITPFMIFILSFIITISFLISCSSALISDKRLCYDEKCSEAVSLAKTLTKYRSNDKNILSFNSNAEVKVYSKSAGIRQDLWGVEINGKRGYVPKSFIRESKILKKDLTFEVPTESIDAPAETLVDDSNKISPESTSNSPSEESEQKPEVSVINSSAEDLKHSIPIPENVSPSYEVIDGTTIPLTINESLDTTTQPVEDATPAEEPVLSIHPHPSLVDSTLSFVSKVYDSVVMRGFENKKKESESINDSENESSEEEAELSKEEGVESEEVRGEAENEVTEEEEKQVENIKEKDEDVPEKESDVKPEENKVEEEKVLQEPKVENDAKEAEKNEESDENDKNEEDESNPVEEQIPEETIEKEISEETETRSETDSLKSSESEKIDSKIDISNNETADEPKSDDDSPIEDKVTEKIPFSYFPTEAFKTEKTVVNQVPLSDTQEAFQVEENVTQIQVNEKENLETENLELEIQNAEESENITSEVLEQDQISKPEIDISFSAAESIPESKLDINIVDSENIDKENTTFDSFQTSIDDVKVVDPFEKTNFVEKNDFSSESVSGENVLSEDPGFSKQTDISKEADVSNKNDFFYKKNVVVDNVASQEHDFLLKNDSTPLESLEPHFHDDVEPPRQILAAEQVSSFNELPSNRNLLNIDESSQFNSQESQNDKPIDEIPSSAGEEILKEEKSSKSLFDAEELEKIPISRLVIPSDVCQKDSNCPGENADLKDENAVTYVVNMGKNYWEFLAYLVITSVTILVFSLGYYYIENARRDYQLIAKINKLEKELMVSTKECTLLNENLTCTKTKLNSIEDESFGSNEMVASLKADIEALQNAKLDLEDQVVILERELESATEAGLELERMLREFLSSNNEDNPLAQSIEDLQARLNAQQAENEALTNALSLKKQETEGLSTDLHSYTKKYEELEIETRRLEDELKTQGNMKIYMEQTLEDKIQRLEMQIREILEERSQLRQGLKAKELEINHLLEVIDQDNSNNLDFDKLYDSVQAKAEALQLAEERDELRLQLKDSESAHKLLEAHVKSAKEEVISLTEECKVFEKEKKDAETKLEVLSNFFKEKEAQRQKEEAVWLEKQGEVSSTVERIHTMQNEIQNYKQQIEILKREIVDQEREYKSQIGALETKAHEHWVVARQNERRLEELKAESGQLRNRLTIVEKSMNDPDPEVKLHRMEVNGESATSPALFLGPDSSNSPIMFSNSSGVPPPPPSYMFGPGFHPYLPPPPPGPGGLPPFDVGQRPPPLGGRLSSPPPLPLQPPSGRYDSTGSPPPLSPPFPPHYGRQRSPPPPFSNDRIHPPLPPPPSLLPIPPLGSSHNWGDESLPPLRNSGFHSHQRDQRSRNHKGSLHSSGESLDKSHHSGKV